MTLESAIPAHLQQERSTPVSMRPNHEPPFPSYAARFPIEVKDPAVAYIGVQDQSGSHDNVQVARSALVDFVDSHTGKAKPEHYDLAAVTDQAGAYNEIMIIYWSSKESYFQWTKESGFEEWFQNLDPGSEKLGWFREVFLPSVDRLETVFSNNVVPEGVGHLRESVSGPVQEHAYWGGMRDRFAIAQTDQLQGDAWKPELQDQSFETSRRRVKVPPRKNLAVIRSGQDWSNTVPEEKKLYLDTMHPVLIKGMNFLRDEGEGIGCFSCRFMDVLPTSTSPAIGKGSSTEKTFGLAYFDDLASLERWSKRHKTHLDIFGGFQKYAKKLDDNISLRLFHEVQVLKPDQQIFEYVNCHSRTGMLVSS